VENEAGEMVWQPAEGGEAVSATEWSRVVAGDDATATTADAPAPDDKVEDGSPSATSGLDAGATAEGGSA